MSRSKFNVIITAVSDAYVNLFIGKLVSNGWTVSPANSKGGMSITGIVTMIALTLEKDKNISYKILIEEMIKIMKLLEMDWFSIIIVDSNDMQISWVAAKQLNTVTKEPEQPQEVIH